MTRLLVIEDEAPLLEIILTMLRYTGFDVVGALDGAAGIGLAHTYRPDLVISDIRMPEMDGYGVLRALREDPVTAALPFIFLTAKAEHEDIRYGMGLGADDYLPKPFTKDELLTAIETRLERQLPYKSLNQRYDEVSKAEQVKTDMIRMAAHDLRSPITSVKVALHILKQKYPSTLFGERLDEIDQIAAAAAQMETITSDILSLERVEATVHDTTFQPVDLVELVRASHQAYCHQAQAKGQRFEMALDQPTAMIVADPAQLREAIHNLISNAIKYTPEGGTIIIHLDRLGNMYRFTVEDTGYGVPGDQIDQLFRPFTRGQTPEARSVTGSGLGLHLVKNIIERHQGEVLVRSVYGEGSVFGFFVPARDNAESGLAAPQMIPQGVIRRLIGHIVGL